MNSLRCPLFQPKAIHLAHLVQASERAQWFSLAKVSVVRATIQRAATRRTASMLFHSAWHTTHGRQDHLTDSMQSRMCAPEAVLDIRACLCMEPPGCHEDQIDRDHPSARSVSPSAHSGHQTGSCHVSRPKPLPYHPARTATSSLAYCLKPSLLHQGSTVSHVPPGS